MRGFKIMIIIKDYTIGNINSLLVEAKENEEKPLPIMIFYHGFQSAKENNLTLAYLLAEQNYRVILPDALYHGERSEKLSSEKMSLSFWEVILTNIRELEEIKDRLEKDGLILDKRIGVAGTSMGGVTTSALLKSYDWIKTGVVLMGSPELANFGKLLIDDFNNSSEKQISEAEQNDVLNELKPFDLSQDLNALNNRPLLFWHGLKDDVVPINHSENFVKELTASSYKGDVKILKEANRGHHLSRYSILETVKWFVKYL